jgi:tetratricopeptide (TPR) repeat protein
MLKLILPLVYIGSALLLPACFNDSLTKMNQQQLEQQRAELDQLKQEVARLETQSSAHNYSSTPAGTCDSNVMREATRKGGESFAAGDFSAALGYYKDALTACPNNAQANLNLARAYEAVGDRLQAVAHYRTAANASGSDVDVEAVHEAHAALTRLGG